MSMKRFVPAERRKNLTECPTGKHGLMNYQGVAKDDHGLHYIYLCKSCKATVKVYGGK